MAERRDMNTSVDIEADKNILELMLIGQDFDRKSRFRKGIQYQTL
jgi:hypothetical protein